MENYVRENGLLKAWYDGQRYVIWNKLHQKEIDRNVFTQRDADAYFENCAPDILPEEPFAALKEELRQCYPVWEKIMREAGLTGLPGVDNFDLFDIAVVGNIFVRFFCAGQLLFKIRMDSLADGMRLQSGIGITLKSAKGESFSAFTRALQEV